MVHTLPDYTSKWKMTELFESISPAELAARLNSPIKKDRRGFVQYIDNFEGVSTKWDTASAGVGASTTLNAAYSFEGDASFKLTTGNVANNYAFMRNTFLQPSNITMGLACHVRLDAADCFFNMSQQGFTGTDYYLGTIHILPDTNELQILTDIGVYTSISLTAIPDIIEELWLPLKFVIDWQNKMYVRAVIGTTEYDLSAYPLVTFGSAVTPCYRVNLRVQTEANANHTAYVDNVIITTNEG